ncbi:MAG: hypothetical protein IGQ45_12165 [Cyanobacterium sp. T60_A2020_053]|nr:hypothetical protein [Cyanobacterium sp. T60_A2020_053]
MNLTSTFQNEKTKIILGDAITVLNEYIEDESINLIFVDPPYFNGAQDKLYNCSFTLKDHER